jgi:hypothetical protein
MKTSSVTRVKLLFNVAEDAGKRTMRTNIDSVRTLTTAAMKNSRDSLLSLPNLMHERFFD